MEKKISDNELIECSIENREILKQSSKCDKNDYLAAVACGAIGGAVDIFLVGSPNDSIIGKWTDAQTEKMVKQFARKMGWNPKEGNQDKLASAIGFLERKYAINYDQRTTADVAGAFQMSTKDHHMKSLAHSPDIIGLFFSVLNQFTSTSTFVSDGQIITIQTETFELEGHTFISKIFCGVANWLGHLMSDIAGSSGSAGNGRRGTGIVMPFYELFELCNFGHFQVGKAKQSLAVIAERAFKEGYDFRFGVATAYPVILTDTLIRLIWSIRRLLQYKMPIKNCIPTKNHQDLRVMLLIGNGTLCTIDITDAGLRSKGNFLIFFTRLNLIGWYSFTSLVVKEVCIRLKMNDGIQKQIDAYKIVNEALIEYWRQLERIDVETYRRETEKYNGLLSELEHAETEQDLNRILTMRLEEVAIECPWNDDFDKFMHDKEEKLVFK